MFENVSYLLPDRKILNIAGQAAASSPIEGRHGPPEGHGSTIIRQDGGMPLSLLLEHLFLPLPLGLFLLLVLLVDKPDSTDPPLEVASRDLVDPRPIVMQRAAPHLQDPFHVLTPC